MKAWLDDPRVKAFKRPVVAICRFNGDRTPQKLIHQLPQNPGVHFQITLNPVNFSRGGEFYRCDGTKGDEIHGWMRPDQIWIEELLGVRLDANTVSVDALYEDFPELKENALDREAA